MRKRLVMLGATGWGNVGDDLIADSILKAVEKYDYHVTLVGGPRDLTQSLDVDRRLCSVDGLRGKLRIAAAIAGSHVVAIGGGGLLEDRDGKFYRPFLRAAELGARTRSKVVFVGIGVGPIRRPETTADYRKILSCSTRISVRDDASKERLLSIANDGQAAKIEVVLDPALWPTSPAVGRKPQAPKFDLALNLRPWKPALPDPGEDIAQLPSFAEITDAVFESITQSVAPGGSIAMLPMSELESENDRAVLEALAPRLSDYHLTWPSQIDLASICEVLEQSKLVLTMRLHAMLVARAMNVPTVAITYDSKVSQQGLIAGAQLVSLTSAAHAHELTAAMKLASDAHTSTPPAQADFEGLVQRLFATD